MSEPRDRFFPDAFYPAPPQDAPPTLDLSFLLRWPDKCGTAVSRRGELAPCDKPAVSATCDPEEPTRPYATCAAHTYIGQAVPLPDLIRAIQEAPRA